jgi:hypothetical protein
MNTQQQDLFDQYVDEFTESESFLPYFTPQNLELVVARATTRIAAAGNFPSYSALEISAAELIEAGIIRRQFTSTPEEEAPAFNLTAEKYRGMSVSEAKRLYNSNPSFRKQLDHLIAIGAV